MAGNLSSNQSSKPLLSAPPYPQQAHTQNHSTSLYDTPHGRRNVASDSQNKSTNRGTATPRNKQQLRGHHKHSRRYQLTDEDAFAESVAMHSTRNKKGRTSITHLMNFSLPPRPSNTAYPNQSRHTKRNPSWGVGSGYHAVDKARYVHANYRFIVDPRYSYHPQCIDADANLEWTSILQILASLQSQAVACPICLDEPVAPRMAKCGHIFCLHCFIRYMNAPDSVVAVAEKRTKWRRCPICEDIIYYSDIKPVRWYIGQEGQPPKRHEDVMLRLVKRSSGSTLALPRDSHLSEDESDIPWHFAADVMDYARVMKGSEEYMIQQLDNELAQVAMLERHDELMFGEDTQWTRRAIRALNEAKETLRGLGNAESHGMQKDHSRSQKTLKMVEDLNPQCSATCCSETSGRESTALQTNIQSENITSTADSNTASNSHTVRQIGQPGIKTDSTPRTYYFYQALVHHYLAPLDIRILKAAFGEYVSFPTTILPRVEHVSTGHVIDDDLRRRAKYLAHLPQGCEVAFIECDWTDTIPEEHLVNFSSELTKRRKRNEEKEVREDKEYRRAEKMEEDRRYAAMRRRRSSSPISRIKLDNFEPLSATDTADAEADLAFLASSPASPPERIGTLGVPSFSASPNTIRTVWGTNVLSTTNADRESTRAPAEMHDEWLKGWKTDVLNERDIGIDVASPLILPIHTVDSSTSSGSKKKKGRKITLMSTSVRRGA